MPKANLEFNLPEEREEFDTAVHGVDYKIAISDFGNFLRNKLKYDTLSEEQYKLYEEVRDNFYRILDENDVST